ncbi:MAG TPA: hypothetical protein VHW01_02470 [Polyangiaceae bacterium]|nr:hypothetical protein [Polyangiaceae bacterium]
MDRALLVGMAVGTGLMLEPFWAGGLEWGFFLTLGTTILEIITAHLLPEPGAAAHPVKRESA